MARDVTVTFTPAQVLEVRGALRAALEELAQVTGTGTERRVLAGALERLDEADRKAGRPRATITVVGRPRCRHCGEES